MKAQEFHNACRTGDVSLVKSYLSQGYDVNEIRTKGGRLGYHTACKYGHIEIVELLATFSPSVMYATDKHGNTGFHDACKNARVAVVEFHVRDRTFDYYKVNKNGMTGWHYVCDIGHLSMVTLFLVFYFNIDIDDKYGITGYHISCRNNDVELYTLLTVRGCDSNARTSDGRNGLHIACAANSLDIVKLIITKPVIMQPQINPNDVDSDNWTPLMYAANNNCLDVVEYLISQNCDISLRNNQGKTMFDLLVDENDRVRMEIYHRRHCIWQRRKSFMIFLVENGYIRPSFTDSQSATATSSNDLMRSLRTHQEQGIKCNQHPFMGVLKSCN